VIGFAAFIPEKPLGTHLIPNFFRAPDASPLSATIAGILTENHWKPQSDYRLVTSQKKNKPRMNAKLHESS